MNTSTPTFASDFNAIRGFRRSFPHLASMSDEIIRADHIDLAGDRYTINIEMVAYSEADRMGELRAQTVEGVPALRRSIKRQGATTRVRAFFSTLPADTARKDALAAAVAAGFAYCTARTQYQVWKSSN